MKSLVTNSKWKLDNIWSFLMIPTTIHFFERNNQEKQKLLCNHPNNHFFWMNCEKRTKYLTMYFLFIPTRIEPNEIECRNHKVLPNSQTFSKKIWRCSTKQLFLNCQQNASARCKFSAKIKFCKYLSEKYYKCREE